MKKFGEIINISKRKNIQLHLKKPFLLDKLNLIIIFYLFNIYPITNQNSFSLQIINHSNNLGLNMDSEIIITLTGNIGSNNIIYCYFWPLPDEIFLNDNKIGEKKCIVNLNNQNETNIKMKWNTKLKTCMSMFYSLSNISHIDFLNFDTSLVTDMSSMFYNCISLQSLNLNKFNTSLVTSIHYMFYGCKSIKSINLSSFDTSLVTDMSYMFYGCKSLKLLNLSNFNTSSVKIIKYMFLENHSLESLDISNFDTSSIIDMSFMFYECKSLKHLDLSSFDTSSVTNMVSMFRGCESLESLNLSNFNTSSVKNMGGMFKFNYLLKSLDISNFDTSLVTNMAFMFQFCNSFESLNLSHFNTSLVKDMTAMFEAMESLKYLDISNFDTSSLTCTSHIFAWCHSLKSLDLSTFNTSNIVNMKEMLRECYSLETLNFFNFSISSATNIYLMLWGCYNLIYINFQNARELDYLDVPNFLYSIKNNIIYCIDEEKAPAISNSFKNLYCSLKDCSPNWRENNEILINYSCSSNCHNLTSYPIKYKNKCIKECPLGTIHINSTCIEYNEKMTSTDNNIKNMSSSLHFYSEIVNYIYYNSYIISDNIYNDTYNNSDYINIVRDDNNNNNNTSDFININTDDNSIDKINNDNYLLHCDISVENINGIIITDETIKNYVNIYTFNKMDRKKVIHYINKTNNFSITIFKDWLCTKDLLLYDYFEIDINKIFNKIKYFNNSDYFIFIYVNYNYNNFFEIQNMKDRNILINLEKSINLVENNIKIKNNFTEEINNYISKVILEKINENNIDIFNKDSAIFNDLCKNFTIHNIDIPIKERREIFYLGNKEKEIICNDINCDIESFSIKNFIGNCNCKININFTNLFLIKESNNYISNDEYEKYINSKTKMNSFLNLKCVKESFSFSNLKNNINFYISIAFISIYIILFCIYYIMSTKNDELEKFKFNPPKIEKFSIIDDLEEENNDNNDLDKNINNNNKNDKIIQLEKKEEEKDDKKSNSMILINNNIDKKINKLLKKNKHNIKNIKRNNEPPLIFNVNSQSKTKEEEIVIKFSNNRTIKNNNNNYSPLEQRQETTDMNSKKYINNKKLTGKDFFTLNKEQNFCYYYWKILTLKQPILNLFTSIISLKTGESYIPLSIKFMRIIFYILLNMFFNSLHLEQIYFRNKFKYFNDKYKIITIFLDKNISFNERFSYAFSHTNISGFISFVICFVIQSTLNYFLFNTKNKLLQLNNKLNILFLYYRKHFLIVFGIKLLLIIFIGYSLITFIQVYSGGFTDLLAGTIWAFLFLQIIPFIYCIIFAFILKREINRKERCLLIFGKIIYF